MDDIDRMLERVEKARSAIVEHAKGEKNFSGMIICPVCADNKKDGRLSFAVHCNGHIHAQCETDGCVSLMEYFCYV